MINMNSFTDIYNSMETKFPLELCTIKDKREAGIYNSNSDKFYLCLVIDTRFKNEMYLKIM